ncbi:VOC family protein [Acetobacteraceae bacterium H6797]|nr:VOC family protein [Acetobacteraceae bacterium H6797]
MFSHIMVGTNDIERSKAFYDAVLGVLGAPEDVRNTAASGHQRVFYRHNGVAFGISQPINDEPACIGNGSTIGLKCDSAEQLQKFHAVAVAQGGTPIEAPPGPRSQDPKAPHLAYVRDPDGNKLCAVYRPA